MVQLFGLKIKDWLIILAIDHKAQIQNYLVKISFLFRDEYLNKFAYLR